MSKALTVDLIHMKMKTNRIDTIKSLNLWGNDLNDISIVNQMQQLEVLSLAVNQISTLRDVQNCYNLKELYMRKNNINNMNEIRYLQDLSKLKIISLGENPIAEHPKYRLMVLYFCPSLEKIDNVDVSDEERDLAE
jgi:Leucine-rich repeat (LRR) protein